MTTFQPPNIDGQPAFHRRIRDAGQERLFRSIVVQLQATGLMGGDADPDKHDAHWDVGARLEPDLIALLDDARNPVFARSRRDPRLCGLPINWTHDESVWLQCKPRPRPWIPLHTDRIDEAAAMLRRAFPGRLAELVAALTSEAG